MTLRVVPVWNPVYAEPRSAGGGMLGMAGIVVNRMLWPASEATAVVINRKAAGCLFGFSLHAFPSRPPGFMGPGILLSVYETAVGKGSCTPYSAGWLPFNRIDGFASVIVAINVDTGECGAFVGHATSAGLQPQTSASPLFLTVMRPFPQVLPPPWSTAEPADVADPLWWQKVGDWHQDKGDPFADVCYQAAGYLGTIIGLAQKVQHGG